MRDTTENRREFRTCVQALFASLGGEFTDAALLGYWIALNDLTLEQIQQACYSAMRCSKHIPKPAELREFVLGTPEDAAELAWSDVLRAVPLGAYKHVDFSDKLINACVRNLGGWPNFLSRFDGADGEKWLRIEFTKCYRIFAGSGVTGEMCQALPGMAQVSVQGGVVGEPIPKRIACTRTEPPKLLTHRNVMGIESQEVLKIVN